MFRRFLIGCMGFPMLLSSFFSLLDILPYGDMYLISNDRILEISSNEKAQIQTELSSILKDATFTHSEKVMFQDEFDDMIKSGDYFMFCFDALVEINGVAFNELVISICPDCDSIEIYKGLNGDYRGRGFTLQTEKGFEKLYEIVEGIKSNHSDEDYTERTIMPRTLEEYDDEKCEICG